MKKQTYKPSLLEALRRQLRSLRMRGDSFRRRHRHRDRSFRDHTREPEDMRLLERRTNQRANSVFFIVLFVCCFLSFLIPLRPTYSDLEQRNLTSFPMPTVATVCDGTFFNDMNTWFADTFPFRESLLKLESGITRLYGIQSTTVSALTTPTAPAPRAPVTHPAPHPPPRPLPQRRTMATPPSPS